MTLLKHVACTTLSVSALLSLTACGGNRDNPKNNLSGVRYDVVVDAGSSGSRQFLYKVEQKGSVAISKLADKALKVPLASFADNPGQAGKDAIEPLLADVMTRLKKDGINPDQVTVHVLATAGMRPLPDAKQKAIYDNVAKQIRKDGFKVGTTKTIDGSWEGAYAWAAVNYLDNGFKTDKTVGIIEVGGASAQIAFALPAGARPTPAPQNNILAINAAGKKYSLYSESFLGLGANSARKSVDAAGNGDACYGDGSTSGVSSGDFNFPRCTSAYTKLLGETKYASVAKITALPGFATQSFIGISGLYHGFKFIGEPTPAKPAAETKITSECQGTRNNFIATHPKNPFAGEQCADASYAANLVYDKLTLNAPRFKVAKEVNNVDLSWTLGYTYLNTQPGTK